MVGKHAWQAQILGVIRYVLLLQHPSDLDEVTGREKAHHTPSTAFRNLPPNFARFSYATEGGILYLRAAVHRRGQRPPKGSGTDKTVEATNLPSTHVNMRRIHPG